MYWKDEDALCTMFFETLSGTVMTPAGRIDLDCYKIRGRGPNAPEKASGADGIGIVSICTPTTTLKGYFLYQAKKVDRTSSKLGAKSQCESMLKRSAASLLLTLLPDQAVVSSAMAVAASSGVDARLDQIPFAGFHRFVVHQLFRGFSLEPWDATAIPRIADLVENARFLVTIIGGRGGGGAGIEPVLQELNCSSSDLI